MNTLIFANCQADGLATFLPLLGYPGPITVFRNYQLILGEQKKEDLFRAAGETEVLIYQPTDPKYAEISSDHIISLLPPGARTVRFAYAYNHGFFPLVEGRDWYIPAFDQSLETALEEYDKGLTDFRFWPRFIECLNVQTQREIDCDVRTASWILDNADILPFLTYNHPDSYHFDAIARQVMHVLKLHITPSAAWTASLNLANLNLANLPCTVPVSEYAVRQYGSKRVPNPYAYDYYRKLLITQWKHHNWR